MWIRNQQRDRLIECSEFLMIESFNEIDFFKDCKKRFEMAVNPVDRRIKYAFEERGIVTVKEIDWYEFYEVEKEKHRNNYLRWLIKSDDTILATYPTKDRCLEVLDEIQQAIVESNTKRYEYVNSESNKIEYTYNNISVYEMPEV